MMDIVDEITLMDYFSGCSTTAPEGPNGRCDPTQVTLPLSLPLSPSFHCLSTDLSVSFH